MTVPEQDWSNLPVRVMAAGTPLIREGDPHGAVYIIRSGVYRIERAGVVIVRCAEPGDFIGEISVLLGTPATATVIAEEAGEVYVVEDAARRVETDAAMSLAIARMLARRLSSMTAYLADLRNQYAGSDSQLDLMDQVLTNLMSVQGRKNTSASARDDTAGD